MKACLRSALAAALFLFSLAAASSADGLEATPYLGTWAFELPDGRPVWLKIERGDGGEDLAGALLWSVGSAKPVHNLRFQNGALQFERVVKWKPRGGATTRQVHPPFTARCFGRSIQLVALHSPMGEELAAAEPASPAPLVLFGKKMPALPGPPDLEAVVFGPPVDLLAQGLDGWLPEDPEKRNGWSIDEEGVLTNTTPKTDFSAYGDHTNLRTTADFEDFELSIEYNVPAKGNSGIYLRGAYEVQVVDRDSRMQGIQGPGAVFGRIAPSHNAGRPGGEWNHYLLTLVDRHITVVLNGERVIENAPLEGCTGGGISADDTRPGPIFLQGDHTSVRYRNIRLRPVLAK